MRTQRLVSPGEYEDQWIAGGPAGMVMADIYSGTLALSVVVHSPVPVPEWEFSGACERMEMPCWYLASYAGHRNRASGLDALKDHYQGLLHDCLAAGDEEPAWRLLEQVYKAYLEGRR